MDTQLQNTAGVLNELRNFRIKRKRIQVMADSDSDCETSHTKKPKDEPKKSEGHQTKNKDDAIDAEETEMYSTRQVYDSEESDSEVNYELDNQRQSVLNFLNKATPIEMQAVKNLSEKKTSVIIEVRPFKNWTDLRQKMETSKSLTPDLLNNVQEYLNKQKNIENILIKCKKLVKRLEEAIKNASNIVDQPKNLNNSLQLADYQKVGLNWLVTMHSQKLNGILADEMGLGKTIQVIAFFAYLKDKGEYDGPHLVVVPSSTLDNWEEEFSKWCPALNIERYHGSQDERRRMRQVYAKHGFGNIDVLLTTYNIVASTPEEKKMFRVCKFNYVVFDEAHMLKNMTTQRYSYLITINAKMRILLTGTPLQNNLLELMSLLCFVMPKMFAKKMEDIKTLFGKKYSPGDKNEESSQFQETQIERAKSIMKPFVLRRLKKDVLNNLPKKECKIHKVPMTEKQKMYYNELIDYYKSNRSGVDGEANTLMMNMRKCANHPLLMRYFFDDSRLVELSQRLAKMSTFKKTVAEYIFEDLAIMSDFQIWQLCQSQELTEYSIPNHLICESGKFKFLDNLLPKLKEEGHRVLLFSQFTMVLDIVERYLSIRNFKYCRLDGQTAVDERQDLINDFNSSEDIFIFLLSTRAGGVGINLTAADTCIIHDIDYNPYNDRQAEDRCHRMGQTKDVTIHRLISEDSIEEGMQQIADEKLRLEENMSSGEMDKIDEQKCVSKLLNLVLGIKN